MKAKKPTRNIPVLFQKLDEYETQDTRFTKVKIWLMHLEENYNGSFFDKKTVTKAIPSLANTPILGFIEDNEDGEDDFSDHRRIMHRDKDGEWRFKYMGSAYGVIPENNNAQFEWKYCDDGVMREFLTVEGLLWSGKFSEVKDIMDRDMVKSQSMELHEDFEGYMDENDYLFHFTKFKFYGSCILGLNVNPAMNSSTIEVQEYSFKDFAKEVNDKMEEFKSIFQENKEGGQGMEGKIGLLKKFSKSEEEVSGMGINLEDISFEELEAKLQETSIDEGSDEQDNEEQDIDNDQDTDVENNEKDESTDDNFSQDDDKSFDEGDNTEENEQPSDNENEDNSVDESNEDSVDYQALYEELKVTHEELVTEVEGLREFKRSRLANDRKVEEDKLFEQYKVLEGIEEYENIKDKASEYSSVADMEKEIALVFVRNQSKINFSTSDNSDNTNRFNFDEDSKQPSKYGNLFQKYGR